MSCEPLPPAEGFVDISPDQDGGLLKKLLVKGEGEETPPHGSEIFVHYTGTLEDGSKFDSSRDRGKEFVTEIGVGQVIKGWDIGMMTMKKGEKAIFRARQDYAYGESGSPPVIPAGATLDFDVEMFRWKEKLPEPYEMSPEERVEYASKQKDLGNAAFKAQDWAAAVEAYDEGARYITHGQGGSSSGQGMDDNDSPELTDDAKKVAVALLTNSAMAKIKIQDFDEAKFDCSKALEFDAKNVKAFFRRAKAKVGLGEWDQAVFDIDAALEIDPDNKEVDTLKKQVEQKKKQEKQKEKAMFSKMFG